MTFEGAGEGRETMPDGLEWLGGAGEAIRDGFPRGLGRGVSRCPMTPNGLAVQVRPSSIVLEGPPPPPEAIPDGLPSVPGPSRDDAG